MTWDPFAPFDNEPGWRDRVDGWHWTIDDEHNVTPVSFNDWMKWEISGEWRRLHQVALTYQGEIMISTVFLAHDHSLMPQTVPGWQPILFETMVFDSFGGPMDEYQARYHTWDDAVAGHALALAAVRLHLEVDETVDQLGVKSDD